MARRRKKSDSNEELMIVNDVPGGGCRIAILQNQHLEELYEERESSATNVGNIYKGRVTNVESGIQAAFIDYGEGQSGFLHISDLHPKYFPGETQKEHVGKKTPRRDRPPIQAALKRGDEILVQVLKEGIGTKGPTLTSYLSIPGRLMVCMPFLDRVGVSRKVEDEDERRNMRKLMDELNLPKDFGFILRTAGMGQTKTELKRDVAYLMRLWKVMEKRIQNTGAPCELYRESDLLIRTVRDVLRPSISAVVVDTDSAYERVSSFLNVVAPRSAPKVLRYRDDAPVFHAFDVERQIELIHSREVPLPSGGGLVIEQTEALVAIDVNSGRSRGSKTSEDNAVKTNTEAVDEICRQLRLRDLGGLLILDLIDMRHMRNRKKIEERIRDNLKRDRAKTTTLRISQFGLVEMTRQRMRPSMRKAHFIECTQCTGHGEIKSPESVSDDAVRHARYLLQFKKVKRVEIIVPPRVASVLLSRKRRELVRIEEETGRRIDVHVNDRLAPDDVKFYAYDDRNSDINVEKLPTLKAPSLKELEKAMESAADKKDSPAADETGETSGRKRRRRRRKRKSGAVADATAIALSGDFSEELEELDRKKDDSKEGSGKKQRRGRKAKKENAGSTSDKPDAERAEDDAASIRIHKLAKELGVKSKEVLERCARDGIEVKNHMSSVTAEQATQIRGWFAEANADAAASADEKPQKKKRSRGRRGGRGRRKSGGEGTDNGQPASDTGTADDEERDAKRKRSRRRKSKADKPAAKTESDKSAADEKPEPTVETTPKPRRSPLYRRRSRVAVTARELTEQGADS